jgi:hypothetical protein
MSTLAAAADALGLNWDLLDPNERDRLLTVETLHPDWSRQSKVSYTRVGNPPIEFPPKRTPWEK